MCTRACECNRVQGILWKLDKRVEHALSEMNSNEVELRCYANGNVNKADEVPVGSPSHSPYFFIEDLRNEKKTRHY